MFEKPIVINPLANKKFWDEQIYYKNVVSKNENFFWFNAGVIVILICIGYGLYMRYQFIKRKKKINNK